MIRHRLIALVLAAAFIVPPTMSAADTELSKYLLVLRASKDRAPDIAALGGQVLRSEGDRWLVIIGPDAVRNLQNHPRVLYLQRLWTGSELLQPVTQAAVLAPDRTVTDSEPPDWQTGSLRYDAAGNIKSMGSDTYAYDSVGRLIRATVNSTTESYKYDWFGNLEMPGAPAVNSANNQLIGATYDPAGNLISDSRGAYRYDAVSMLTGHTPQGSGITPSVPRRMIYTAEDQRVAVVVTPGGGIPSTMRITARNFGGEVLREFEKNDVAAEWRRDYVYSDGDLVAGERQVPNGETGYRHFHSDHLGSVRLITRGGDAARISTPKYFPFGDEVQSSTDEYAAFKYSPLEPMKFAGHERDYYGMYNVPNDDHFDYMMARYYTSSAGRFLSVDPMPGSAVPSRPQTWNRYAYAINNPVVYVDPTGRAPNKAGTTEPSVILREIMYLQSQGKSKQEIFDTLAEQHKSNKNRYFFTTKYGWIDVRHFGAAASTAYTNGSVATEVLGVGMEVAQYATEWGDDYRSGFSSEDLNSNAAGAEFGDDYLDTRKDAVTAFKEWLKDSGAKGMNSPEAQRDKLPDTDPAKRATKEKQIPDTNNDVPKKKWWHIW
jgi:RHS repeat-associated protein